MLPLGFFKEERPYLMDLDPQGSVYVLYGVGMVHFGSQDISWAPPVCQATFVLLVHISPHCLLMTNLSIHQLMDIGIISTFWLLWMKCHGHLRVSFCVVICFPLSCIYECTYRGTSGSHGNSTGNVLSNLDIEKRILRTWSRPLVEISSFRATQAWRGEKKEHFVSKMWVLVRVAIKEHEKHIILENLTFNNVKQSKNF